MRRLYDGAVGDTLPQIREGGRNGGKGRRNIAKIKLLKNYHVQ